MPEPQCLQSALLASPCSLVALLRALDEEHALVHDRVALPPDPLLPVHIAVLGGIVAGGAGAAVVVEGPPAELPGLVRRAGQLKGGVLPTRDLKVRLLDADPMTGWTCRYCKDSE